MKSYVFPIVIEPDEDKWSAYVPGMVDKGAAAWGESREEAERNIREVTQMVIESMIEHGEPLPKCVTEYECQVASVSV